MLDDDMMSISNIRYLSWFVCFFLFGYGIVIAQDLLLAVTAVAVIQVGVTAIGIERQLFAYNRGIRRLLNNEVEDFDIPELQADEPLVFRPPSAKYQDQVDDD